MENFWMYREALMALTESVCAAKMRGDGGVYRTVSLESLEAADRLAKFFLEVDGLEVEMCGTNTPNRFGFFIAWDD